MKKYYLTILCGLFIALQVVIGRWLAIDLGFMRISLVFLPIALGGAILGPLWNGVICALADIIGFLLVPSQGAFFPGFTVSAFLSGYAYGYFLYTPIQPLDILINSIYKPKENKTYFRFSLQYPQAILLSSAGQLIARTFLAAFCVTILIDAFLNTLWVSILYKNAYTAYFATRLVKSAAMLPLHVIVFSIIWRILGKFIVVNVYPKIR